MPCLANSVDPDQLASEKPADLDLHCLSFSMQICIGHLGQVIWLAEIRSECGVLIYSAW